jgi:hypothetical protein
MPYPFVFVRIIGRFEPATDHDDVHSAISGDIATA